jgi:branched-chain amino acid transport system permease protein
MAILYGMLSICLNLCSGRTGLLSLSQAAFYGIGAYTTAILSTRFQIHLVFALFAGVIFAAILAIPIGLVAMRCRGELFMLCTLSANAVLWGVTNSWTNVTRGALGISGIPGLFFFNSMLSVKIMSLCMFGFTLCVMYMACARIMTSPIGRAMWGLDSDPVFLSSVGKNTRKIKLTLFILASALSAIPGALYACYASYIDPTSFTIMDSIFCLAIIIIGGLGNLRGGLIATIALISLPELLRFLAFPTTSAAQLRQIFYGLALIICMLWRPQGLIGECGFGSEAKPQ